MMPLERSTCLYSQISFVQEGIFRLHGLNNGLVIFYLFQEIFVLMSFWQCLKFAKACVPMLDCGFMELLIMCPCCRKKISRQSLQYNLNRKVTVKDYICGEDNV